MAYEVTKRIKGHEYRYRVEGMRDPATGRTRNHWHYLGRIDGDDVIEPARVHRPRATRDEIVAATARLLQSRDASRVTVAVIAQRAGISEGTFYRHFGDRRSALGAAVAHLCDGVLRDLPSLDGPLGPQPAERERLFDWFAALHHVVLNGRAFRWVITGADRATYQAVADASPLADDLQRALAAYLRRLHVAEFAHIADPDRLAVALLGLHRSFVRDMASADDASEVPSRWRDVFPAVERAVFLHQGPAT